MFFYLPQCFARILVIYACILRSISEDAGKHPQKLKHPCESSNYRYFFYRALRDEISVCYRARARTRRVVQISAKVVTNAN